MCRRLIEVRAREQPEEDIGPGEKDDHFGHIDSGSGDVRTS